LSALEFWRDVAEKQERRAQDAEADRDRWKAILSGVVGDLIADRMFYDDERASEAPRALALRG